MLTVIHASIQIFARSWFARRQSHLPTCSPAFRADAPSGSCFSATRRLLRFSRSVPLSLSACSFASTSPWPSRAARRFCWASLSLPSCQRLVSAVKLRSMKSAGTCGNYKTLKKALKGHHLDAFLFPQVFNELALPWLSTQNAWT